MLRLHHSPNFQEKLLISTEIFSTKNSRTQFPPGIARDLHTRFPPRNKRFSRFLQVINAVEKDSEFQFDPIKAREALRKLDEEFESSISQKRNDPMKVTSSDLDRLRGPVTEGSQEISGTSLTNLAAGLLIFTIFYNILFLTVIKPAIDGPDEIQITGSMPEAKSDP